jgi:large subunit ribosomal protein L9
MKVILREEVEALGNAGDIVNVKDGYARNFLLPRQMAMRADERNTKQLEHVKRAMLLRRSRLEDAAKGRSKVLEDLGRVVFVRSCSGERKLFGSVTSRDIAGALAERGIEVDRRRIQLGEPLKALGDFDVNIKLGQGVVAPIKVSIEPDEASAELIAQAVAAAASVESPASDYSE